MKWLVYEMMLKNKLKSMKVKEVDEFYFWCFGRVNDNKSYGLKIAWNKLHPHEIQFGYMDFMENCFPKMLEIYEKFKEEKKDVESSKIS